MNISLTLFLIGILGFIIERSLVHNFIYFILLYAGTQLNTYFSLIYD